MKKALLVSIAIGLFAFFSIFTAATTASTAETVTYDGKMLYFPPQEQLAPADITWLGFDLANVPPDMQWLIGKVFRVQFKMRSTRTSKLGARRYVIFTKWTREGKIEIFWYPAGQKGDRHYLDCDPIAGDSNGYSCKVRGRTLGNGYKLWIKNQKLDIQADDGAPADSEVVYTFEKMPSLPPAAQSQTGSPQP